MLRKIKPAIEQETLTKTERNGSNKSFVTNVTTLNVFLTVQKVREQSPLLSEMEKTEQIKIVGGLYDLDTGKVIFYE